MFELDINELRSKLPYMCHSYTEMIVNEANTLNIQLAFAIKKRGADIAKDSYNDKFGINDIESKLLTIKRHSINNFKELEELLSKGVYCPFCFIFRNNRHKLTPHIRYNRGKLQCPMGTCSDKIFDPPE